MDDEISEHKQRADVLEALEYARDPVLTTEEIADHLGIPRTKARIRLMEMEKNGMVKSKQEVWWATPAPYLEMQAILLLQPWNKSLTEPLSIEQIRDTICDE